MSKESYIDIEFKAIEMNIDINVLEEHFHEVVLVLQPLCCCSDPEREMRAERASHQRRVMKLLSVLFSFSDKRRSFI